MEQRRKTISGATKRAGVTTLAVAPLILRFAQDSR
jgi:hypothetical protein